jgi:hypothetical protein
MATEQQWATVCAQWPGPGHKSHLTVRTNKAKAKQAVIDNNHHAEMLAAKLERHWYIDEAPFKLMSREVADWTEVTGDE